MTAVDETRNHDSARKASPGISSLAMDWVERLALVGMLIATVVLFSVLPQTKSVFFSALNLQIMLGNQSVLLLAALATLLPLLTNQYDLSIGNIVTLSSVVTATALSQFHANVFVGVLVGILVSAVVGAFNGWLTAYVGVNSLITTLGVGTAITGVILGYTGGRSIVSGLPKAVSEFGIGSVGPVPYVFIAAAVVAAILGYFMRFLPVGRRMIAVGSNPAAARLVGIGVPRVILLSFVLAAAVAGVGGALQLAQTGAANPSLGGTLTLPALAAVFLGSTAIRPGRYNIAGTIIAVLFLGALTSGLSLAGLPDWVNTIVNGGALVVGVALSAVLSKRGKTT